MNINPSVSKVAVNPQIMAFVNPTTDCTRLARINQLLTWGMRVPIKGVPEVPSLSQHFSANSLTPDQPNSQSLSAMTSTFLTFYNEEPKAWEGNLGVEDFLNLVGNTCASVLKLRLATSMGLEGANGLRVIAAGTQVYMDEHVINTKKAWDGAMPFYVDGKAVLNLDKHLEIAYTMTKTIEKDARMRGIVNMDTDSIYYFYMPWLVIKFLASFVPGRWNITTYEEIYKPWISFYDMRYAELAIFRVIQDTIMMMRNYIINMDGSTEQKMVASVNSRKLEQFAFQINASVKNRFIVADTAEFQKHYTKSKSLSDSNVANSYAISKDNDTLSVRKENLNVLLINLQNDERSLLLSRSVFMIFVGMYFITTLGALVLLYNKKYKILNAVGGTIVCLLIIVSLIRMVMFWNNDTDNAKKRTSSMNYY